MNDVMFPRDGQNRRKSYHMTRIYRRVRQVTAPGAKSAAFDSILYWALSCMSQTGT